MAVRNTSTEPLLVELEQAFKDLDALVKPIMVNPHTTSTLIFYDWIKRRDNVLLLIDRIKFYAHAEAIEKKMLADHIFREN